MSEVVEFRAAGDRQADHMVDQLCAIVDGHQTITGINACLQTLAILIVGYGQEHGDTAGIAHRAGATLAGMVDGLASDMSCASSDHGGETAE